ncbi:uncharacterized protein LY89DRAFT_689202 [Mollisia scopiformis]|uniref:Apple domain-containing protein n=1 Tax=Mollisia scopiformis TaxID=149040 RepID=A0A194WTN9_MOLSC|nr:uncharacterized protein LY89DRAFT_689202 [Mollisia scopiformis]KUJ11325.1 hypothetical protein LY89DRAFT_689202 [Mollisia scopiformis]
MRSTFFLCLASARNLVAALPSLNSGLSDREQAPDHVLLEARQAPIAQTWTQPHYCTASTESGNFHDIYTALVNPSRSVSFDYSSFCSAVVRQTTIAWVDQTLTGRKTETLTSTTTTSVSTTSTDTSPGTTTLLCPTPSASMACGVSANGYYSNMITDQYIPSADCHQLCLSMSDCKSFQVVPQDNGIVKFDRCNLYNVSVAGNVDTTSPGIVALFYDRDCGDLLPSGCTPSPPLITPAPSYSPTVAAIQKRDYTVPPFLSSMQLILLQPVCSCLVDAAPPPTIITATNQIQSWDYVTVTTLKTEVYSYTDHPEWQTVYTSVV